MRVPAGCTRSKLHRTMRGDFVAILFRTRKETWYRLLRTDQDAHPCLHHCQNGCSGHGTCTLDRAGFGKCVCDAGYRSGIPFGQHAFAGSPSMEGHGTHAKRPTQNVGDTSPSDSISAVNQSDCRLTCPGLPSAPACHGNGVCTPDATCICKPGVLLQSFCCSLSGAWYVFAD
jgi:hypothetical protein